MTLSKTKCTLALKALVRPLVNRMSWKTLVLVFFLGATTCLSSCTAFEESYYTQADGEDLPPGCKIVDSVIICE